MNWSVTAGILLGLAVAIGAFGAHGLKDHLDPYSMGIYEKGVFYHFIHALGMLVVSVLPKAGVLSPDKMKWICALLFAGIVAFSGSLYLLAVTGAQMLGLVTPIGGLCFLAAWFLLAVWLGATSGR